MFVVAIALLCVRVHSISQNKGRQDTAEQLFQRTAEVSSAGSLKAKVSKGVSTRVQESDDQDRAALTSDGTFQTTNAEYTTPGPVDAQPISPSLLDLTTSTKVDAQPISPSLLDLTTSTKVDAQPISPSLLDLTTSTKVAAVLQMTSTTAEVQNKDVSEPAWIVAQDADMNEAKSLAEFQCQCGLCGAYCCSPCMTSSTRGPTVATIAQQKAANSHFGPTAQAKGQRVADFVNAKPTSRQLENMTFYGDSSRRNTMQPTSRHFDRMADGDGFLDSEDSWPAPRSAAPRVVALGGPAFGPGTGWIRTGRDTGPAFHGGTWHTK